MEATLIQTAALHREAVHVELVQEAVQGSQNIETDQWDFEETTGDKISDENAFGGIVGPKGFEPCENDAEEEGGSVIEYETAGHMVTSAW